MEDDDATELVLGLKARPRMAISLPTTESRVCEIFSTRRSDWERLTSRAAQRILSGTPEHCARLASDSMSASTKAPPRVAPGCRQRGAIFLSSPMARARSAE